MDEFCGSAFWNASLTVDTPDPDVTPCFQKTVLVWIPCGFLFITAPFYIYNLTQSDKPSIGLSWLNITKTVVSAVLAAVLLTELFYNLKLKFGDDGPVFGADLCAPAVNLLALGLSIVFVHYGRQRGERSSGYLFIFWLLHTLASIFILKYKIGQLLQHGEVQNLLHFTVSVLFSVGVLLQTILANFVDKPSEFSPITEGEKPCPEIGASFLSRITFWWFTSMAIKGYKKPLEKKDLWALSTRDMSRIVVPQFQQQWQKEMSKYKCSPIVKYQKQRSVRTAENNHNSTPKDAMNHNEQDASLKEPLQGADADGVDVQIKDGKDEKIGYQPSLVKALARAFGSTFLGAAFFKLLNDILTFVSPQILKLLINFTKSYNIGQGDYVWKGYVYAGFLFIVAFTQSMVLHQYFHRCFTVGMRLRTALVSAVYRKALRLSNSARRTTTVGEITNLMAVDAQRFVDVSTNINLIWSTPFQMCVALYFLWQELGPSVLAGLAVMLLMLPINAFIAKISRNLQVIQMKNKDSRIRLMSEILNGIRVLKLYAWELSFEEKILGIRNKELEVLRKSAYLNATSTFTWTCAPFLVSLTTFAVYTLSSPDNVLDAEKAFVSLALFNILRFPLSVLPMLIASLVQVSVSVKRLTDYLKKEELDESIVQHNCSKKVAVKIENGTFTWDKDEPPSLTSLDVEIKQGSLVAVVGSVGSGKSSLLAAILGEMDKLEGTVNTKGNVAYVAQQAWIQNATLKNNIFFGKNVNEGLYHKVLQSCALETDLQMLPGGDMTEIGEKGINLSGGQKQRVNLGRAVYQDADVYLLDDPLSAVDAHIGKHIFEQVIGPKGLLKNKTRILVTHGISFLPQVDQIIVLVDGQISEMGTYKQLLNAGASFADFLRSYLLEEVEEEIEEIAEKDKSLRNDIITCIGDMCYKDGKEMPKEEAERLGAIVRQLSMQDTRPRLTRQFSQDGHNLARQISRPLSRHIERQMSRQLERQLSKQFDLTRQLTRHKSISSDEDKEEEEIDIVPQRARLTRQITIADDECHPPQALMGKVQETDRLIQTETTEKGSVKLSVFLTYMRAVGLPASILIIMFYVLANTASVGSNFWLSDWSMDAVGPANNSSHSNGTGAYDNSTQSPEMLADDSDLRNMRLGVYAALGLAQGFAVMGASFVFASGRVHAARRLHGNMLANILRSPVHFFDVTPLGRITNRFSKDLDMIDLVIPATVIGFILTMMASFCSLLVISISTPIFLAVLLPLGILYFFIQRFYVATSRQLKRLESVTRSPIYSNFSETVTGAQTIRAYGQQERFISDSEAKLDDNQKCYYPNISSNRWLAIRLELVGNCIVLSAALFAVIGATSGSVDAGIVGLSVSYAMTITSTLNMMVRMTSELETNIVAVERVKEYSETPQEKEWVVEEKRPPAEWPKEGRLEFSDYITRYRPGLDLVLKGISCDIKGGEKVGIVGRTGAGKSSLTLALFRIIEPAGGNITIDGIPITDIGLHDLRSKLTIIPQDPVVFSGTLRMNLDPFDKYQDEDLWRALENAHLKDFVNGLTEGLNFMCSEGGENLSVGQRQLVCLARALLRKSKILILDEATAAVDLETDDLIQTTIRTEFEGCTVFTIAHRLNTIMDYNRIMVLSAGQIAEFDEPKILLEDKNSIFYGMAKDAGLVE